MRVLATCQPSLSHAVQVVGLARALEADGHAVTIATPQAMAGLLQGHGLDARPVAPDWEMRPGDGVWDATVGSQDFFGFPSVATADTLSQLTALATEVGADLIVREYAEFAGWAVARSLGRPFATVGIMHRLPPPAEAVVVQRAGELASLAGIAPPLDMDDLLGGVFLDPVPPSFRMPWEGNGPRHLPIRPSLFDGDRGEPSPDWLDTVGVDRPLVYVTLGNVFSGVTSVWNTVLEALAGFDVDVVATVGGLDPASLTEGPRTRIVRQIPQGRILKRARAVVCHAGFNTVLGALAHGVPIVALPLGADQPVNAGCLAAVGAGVNAANAPARDPRGPWTDPTTLTVAEVTDAVRAVLDDPAYSDAARRVAAEIADLPPADAAIPTLARVSLQRQGS